MDTTLKRIAGNFNFHPSVYLGEMRSAGVTALTILLLATAACQEPLEGTGGFSERFVRGSTTSFPTERPQEEPQPMRDIATVGWRNDRLGLPAATDQLSAVVREVWSRNKDQEAFVQASRYEIAVAVPKVRVPQLVPAQTEYITSQLVFQPETGDLAAATVAAFGLWSVLPYSVSRSVGQLSALMVGPGGALPEPGEGVAPCDGYDPGTDASCDVSTVGRRPAWSIESEEGYRLVWTEGDYRYELTCRGAEVAPLCPPMAESMMPLATLTTASTSGQ